MRKSVGFLCAAVMGLISATAVGAQETTVPLAALMQPRTVTTSGTFAVEVPPNQVLILMGIKTSNGDLKQAKEQNDARIRSVLATAKSVGVPIDHVQTGTISITPKYPDNKEDYGKILSYVVERRVVIDLRDMSKFEELISECLKDGANSISNIEFRTTDLKKHRMLARKEAAKMAREKADVLVTELGAQIGKVRTVTEYSPDSLSPYSYSRYGAGAMSQASNSGMSLGESGGGDNDGGTLAPGHLSIRSTVTVVWDLQ